MRRCDDSVECQPTGNDVIVEWRHRAAGSLSAAMFARHRLRHCHISRYVLVFTQPGSGHRRQLPVSILFGFDFVYVRRIFGFYRIPSTEL